MAKNNIRLFVHAFLIALPLIFLSACDGSSENVKSGDRDYPVKNKNPSRFLKISGTIARELDVVFYLSWYAANPACKYYTARLEGATTQFSASEVVEVARAGEVVIIDIPIDGVLPGRCDWKFGGVVITSESGYGMSLVRTNSYPLKPGQSPDGVINLVCENTVRKLSPIAPQLVCQEIEPEDANASVNGGVLWWHPEAKNLEIHIQKKA